MSNQLMQCEQMVQGAEKAFTEIAAAEGNLVTYQKEAMFALQTLQGSEYLQKSDKQSIQNAVINVASIGLSLNPALSFAYLVPRDGKCCLDISYKGMVKIATDTGSILWAKAELVRESDNFQYNGFGELPDHKYNPFAKGRGEVIGAYCVAKLHDGTYMVEVMDRAELDKVRNTSKAKNGPWKTWEEEMMKKTIIKRAYKSWPKTSRRMAEAVHIVNEHEGLDLSGESEQVTEEAVIQPLSDDDFNGSFQKWSALIASGQQTLENLKSFIESKGKYLTDEQVLKFNQDGE
ncbi:MAG: recombinase RecT [candidate division Zixibacteria bacterium]|nr:recombinase RecT [candidate division Zixibacteria bacterium]